MEERELRRRLEIIETRLDKGKSKPAAYIFLLFLGVFGAHNFYLRKPVLGILYLFTGGFFAIGYIVDIFILGYRVDNYNLALIEKIEKKPY